MAKKGRFARKKKKSFVWIWILPVLLLLGFCSWFFLSGMEPADATEPQNETDAPSADTTGSQNTVPATQMTAAQTLPPETTAPATTAQPEFTLSEAYREVLNRYRQAIGENWDFIGCEENQISYLVMFLDNPDGLGYYLADLDDNGTTELVISDGNVIYDLYTQAGDEAVWILTGGERNSYYLCEDGLIFNHGSSSAFSYVQNYYRLESSQLITVHALTCEASNEGVTWTLMTEGSSETEQISDVQANMLIASHKRISIEVTPFPD